MFHLDSENGSNSFLCLFSFLSIQPIYYQQPSTGTLLATGGAPQQTLNSLLQNQSTAAATGANIHGNGNASSAGHSYYELTYATTPSIEQASYIYATAPGQTFSYASLPPTGANGQPTMSNNLADVYGSHTTKFLMDDHGGSIDREHHQRATPGW